MGKKNHQHNNTNIAEALTNLYGAVIEQQLTPIDFLF